MNKKAEEQFKKFLSFASNISDPSDLALIIIEKGAKKPSGISCFEIKKQADFEIFLKKAKTARKKKLIALSTRKILGDKINLFGSVFSLNK